MTYNPNIHALPHLIKSVFGHAEYFFTGLNYGPDELLVVNYHSTPAKYMDEFRSQIRFFQKKFNIISPAELDDYFAGRLKTKKSNLLITFDDGLKNNLHAAKVLEEFGIKAFFFLVPAFLNCKPSEQKNYYLKNIRPLVNKAIDNQDEDFSAMTDSDIKALIAKGHAIGSHTYTHTLVASRSDEANSEKEIVSSKSELERRFGLPLDSFCSINNTLESIGSKEKKLIEGYYNYHFTTIPGFNKNQRDPLFIRRRNIECFWLKGAVYFALGKWDLGRWKEKEEKFIAL
jgi:peptidoglycan/xylan/chitin deacetylase (PgdA/CDA1 family)